MNIRPRLALGAVTVVVPVAIALTWWDGRERHHLAELVLGQLLVRESTAPDARERCEADPTALVPRPPGDGPPGFTGPLGPPPGRHGPPPGGPPMRPPRLAAHDDAGWQAAGWGQLEVGVLVARPVSPWSGEVDVALRTGWGGPCAVLVVNGSTSPGALGSVLPRPAVWLSPLVVVAAVLALAVEPVVRRVRRLTALVRAPQAAELRRTLGGDDELSELAAAFDHARAALRAEVADKVASEQALREFVGNTVHDVMIPLTVLLGHLSELRRRGADEALVARALGEAHYLGALVQNLSAASRLDTPAQWRRDPVDLGRVVERVIARHAPLAATAGVDLVHAVPEAPVTLDGDVTLLEQAVGNLVYNAIRYNRRGGHTAVTLEPFPGGFVLSVVDDGPGLDDDALARLGERGFRADDARTRAPDGQGLGVHIARRVAEEHGLTLRFARSGFGGLHVTLARPPGLLARI